MKKFDVIIIGGGPAGSAAAVLLAKAGWSVAIVEQSSFPRRKVCGEFISASSQPLLHELGIGNFYTSHAGPEITRVGLFAANCVMDADMPPAEHLIGLWGRALGREHLDLVLLETAARNGTTIFQPWKMVRLQRHSHIWMCSITNKHEIKNIEAQLIIKANGSWERDTHINIPAHKSSDLLAFKAHFRNSSLDINLMPLISFPGGYGGLVHSDNDRVSLSCCIRRDVLQSVRRQNLGLPAGEAVLRHITETTVGVRDALSCAKREGPWLAVGPIFPGIRKRYAEGIFYTGNIAGEAHPIVAEGISMAMQSSFILSKILIANQDKLETDIDNIGQYYTRRWNSQFAKRVYAAELFAQIAMRPYAMSMILPFVKRFPNVLSLGAKLSGKVKQI